MTTLFISHSSSDNSWSERIGRKFHEVGYTSLFLDFDPQEGLAAGTRWEQELYRNIKHSQAVIAVCSKNALQSKWCFAELTQARALGKPIFPLLIDDSRLPEVLSEHQGTSFSGDFDDAMARLLRGLAQAGLGPEGCYVLNRQRGPYPGLLAFDEQDAAVYFGREDDLRDGLDTLRRMRRLKAASLLLVLGASGSGKSSLVRAGLLPRLRREPESWLVAPAFRPLKDPMNELARCLADLMAQNGLTTQQSELLIRLQSAPDGAQALGALVQEIHNKQGRQNATLLLVIDQLEEMLSGAGAESPHNTFLQWLGPVFDGRLPILVVATLRSDFLGELQKHPVLGGVASEHLSLGPVKKSGFTRMVEGPASAFGVTVEPELVALLVDQAGTQEALPLLAFALRRIWETRQDQVRLTVTDYTSTVGDLARAVARPAEQVLGACSGDQDVLSAVRDAFLVLTQVNEQGQYVRRVAHWAQLPTKALPVLERLVQARLLVTQGDGTSATVEVAHEALFRSWERLAAWLAENRDFLLWRRSIAANLAQWQQSGEESAQLLKGAVLQRAESWLARFGSVLSSDERRFVQTSMANRSKRQRLLRLTGLLLAVVLVSLTGYALVAKSTSEENERQATESKKAALLAQSQAEDARVRAEAAQKEADEQALKESQAREDAQKSAQAAKEAEAKALAEKKRAQEKEAEAKKSEQKANKARQDAEDQALTARGAAEESPRQAVSLLARIQGSASSEAMSAMHDALMKLPVHRYSVKTSCKGLTSPELTDLPGTGRACAPPMVISGEQQRLALACDSLVEVFDLESGQAIGQPVSTNGRTVGTLSFRTSDGALLVSFPEERAIDVFGFDQGKNSWTSAGGIVVAPEVGNGEGDGSGTVDHGDGQGEFQFSADGELFFFAGQRAIAHGTTRNLGPAGLAPGHELSLYPSGVGKCPTRLSPFSGPVVRFLRGEEWYEFDTTSNTLNRSYLNVRGIDVFAIAPGARRLMAKVLPGMNQMAKTQFLQYQGEQGLESLAELPAMNFCGFASDEVAYYGLGRSEVRVVEAGSGNELARVEGLGQLAGAVMSNNGRDLVTLRTDGTLDGWLVDRLVFPAGLLAPRLGGFSFKENTLLGVGTAVDVQLVYELDLSSDTLKTTALHAYRPYIFEKVGIFFDELDETRTTFGAFDINTGKRLWTLPESGFDYQGLTLASSQTFLLHGLNPVTARDAASGKVLWTWPRPDNTGYPILAMAPPAFSTNQWSQGEACAVVDSKTGKPFEFPESAPARAVDGNWKTSYDDCIFTSTNGWLYSLKSDHWYRLSDACGEIPKTKEVHSEYVFGPNGDWYAVLRFDHKAEYLSNLSSISICDAKEGVPGFTHQPPNPCAAGGELDAPARMSVVKAFPDSLAVQWACGDLQLVDLSDLAAPRTLTLKKTVPVSSFEMHSDQRRVLLADSKDRVQLWDFSTGEIVYTLAHYSQPRVAFTPDGTRAIIQSTVPGTTTPYDPPYLPLELHPITWSQMMQQACRRVPNPSFSCPAPVANGP